MAWQVHPRLPLVLAANRDEFHDRESAPMAWWDGQGILAGRDLRAGGTWLGLSQAGRIALLTNVREPGPQEPKLPSRGALVPMWLQGEPAAPEMAQRLQAMHTNGYNLLGIDLMGSEAHCWSNRHGHQHSLPPGLYGLSNAALDTPWPKLKRLKHLLDEACRQPDGLSDTLMRALTDRQRPHDEQLPQTGISKDWERWLSSIFIQTPHGRYGTRCSTVIVVEQQGPQEWQVRAVEQGWDAQGRASSRVELTWMVTRPAVRGA